MKPGLIYTNNYLAQTVAELLAQLKCRKLWIDEPLVAS